MHDLLKEIDKELQQLNQIETRAKDQLALLKQPSCLKKLVAQVSTAASVAPDHMAKASVRVSRTHGTWQLYLVTDITKSNGKYLKRRQWSAARYLVQREYLLNILTETARRKKTLLSFKAKMQKQLPGNDAFARFLHESIHPARLMLIDKVVESNQEYAEHWIQTPVTPLAWKNEDKIFITDRGDRVRSKSEKIIADKLYHLGIPYRYESPLKLPRTDKIVYPDFTILRLKDRKEIYVEHFGMFDDPEYAYRNVGKLNDYAINGIIWGINAIFCMETKKVPLNIKVFEMQIRAMGIVDDEK